MPEKQGCVERAIGCFNQSRGPASELARRLGVSRQEISHWLARGYFPSKYALDVQAATGGNVTAAEVLLEIRDTAG